MKNLGCIWLTLSLGACFAGEPDEQEVPPERPTPQAPTPEMPEPEAPESQPMPPQVPQTPEMAQYTARGEAVVDMSALHPRDWVMDHMSPGDLDAHGASTTLLLDGASIPVGSGPISFQEMGCDYTMPAYLSSNGSAPMGIADNSGGVIPEAPGRADLFFRGSFQGPPELISGGVQDSYCEGYLRDFEGAAISYKASVRVTTIARHEVRVGSCDTSALLVTGQSASFRLTPFDAQGVPLLDISNWAQTPEVTGLGTSIEGLEMSSPLLGTVHTGASPGTISLKTELGAEVDIEVADITQVTSVTPTLTFYSTWRPDVKAQLYAQEDASSEASPHAGETLTLELLEARVGERELCSTNLPLQATSKTPDVCVVDGETVTFATSGDCELEVSSPSTPHLAAKTFRIENQPQ